MKTYITTETTKIQISNDVNINENEILQRHIKHYLSILDGKDFNSKVVIEKGHLRIVIIYKLDEFYPFVVSRTLDEFHEQKEKRDFMKWFPAYEYVIKQLN